MRSTVLRAPSILVVVLGLLFLLQQEPPPGPALANSSADPFWTQLAKLTASDAHEGDWLGFSVAIDGNVAVAGAPKADVYGEDSGVVYVFEKGAHGWRDMQQTAELFPTDGKPHDEFGSAVGISGDTIVVGAPYAAAGAPASGALYAFVKPSTGWRTKSQNARLTRSNPAEGDWLGLSLAITGQTIAAGAPGVGAVEDGGPGAVLLFEQPAGGWRSGHETATLTASDGAPWDGLGFSVSLDAETVAAGAPFDDNAGVSSGAAYLFARPPGGWIDGEETARLSPAAGAVLDWFGRSVALTPQGVVVGAPQNDDRAANAGAAYYFQRPETGWQDAHETAELVPSAAHAEGRFAWSAAAAGETIAIGAGVGAESTDTGQVYLFAGPPPAQEFVEEDAILYAGDAHALDRFGISVAGSADTLLIGADSTGIERPNSGSAYIFARGGLVEIAADSDPPGGQGFLFAHTLPGEKHFALDAGQSRLFEQVPAGSYIVAELDPRPAFDVGSVECVDSDPDGGPSSGSAAARSAHIELDPGETVFCRFGNTQRGQIVVTKSTEPAGAAQLFTLHLSGGPEEITHTFSLADGDEPHSSGPLRPGTYALSEEETAAWQLASAACSSGTPQEITLLPGKTVTCHITNQQLGRILVAKETIPPLHFQSFVFTLTTPAAAESRSFSLSARDEPFDSGYLAPGTYTVTEQLPPHWALQTSNCSDGRAPDQIQLQPGETVTCTFTNRLLRHDIWLPLLAN